MKIDDALEEKLATYFAPTYFSSDREYQYLVELEHDLIPKISLCYPPWKPCIYYSIFRWPSLDNHDFFEINYLSIWDRDTGINGHEWDTERMAQLIKSPIDATKLSQFEIQEMYFAAHEGEGPFNRSKYLESPDLSEGITVYWSHKKHGSYPSSSDANGIWPFEEFKKPGKKADPKGYTLKNAGTVVQPAEPWIGYQEGWGQDHVSSVYSKLKDRIWSPVPGSSKWQRNLPGEAETREEIKKFQRSLNLRATGKINKELYDQISIMPTEIIRNASMMDQDVIKEVIQLHPKKLDAGQVAALDVPANSLRTPKTIDGDINGIIGANTIILGKINSRTIIYGLVDSKDQKIFAIKKASIKTLREPTIKSSKLRKI